MDVDQLSAHEICSCGIRVKESCSSPQPDQKGGWVYVLSNPSMPGLLKIGMTRKSVQERMKQLSCGTSTPTPFELEFSFWWPDVYDFEQKLHKQLSNSRVGNKEFFNVSETFVLEACIVVAGGGE